MTYRVIWEIDVEADNPREAAEKARHYQIVLGTTARVFDVVTEHGTVRRFDLDKDPPYGEGTDVTEERKPRVLITMEGGLIQHVAADREVRIDMIDYDRKEGPAEDSLIVEDMADVIGREEYARALAAAEKDDQEYRDSLPG